MIHRSTSDILSPRELRKQISWYFTLSAVFVLLLTIFCAGVFLDFEIADGVSLPIWSSGVSLFSLFWRVVVLLLLSVTVGYIIALPSVILLWIANSGGTFSTHSKSISSRLRRSISGVFPPGLCIALHVAFLGLSLGAHPAWVATHFSGIGALSASAQSINDTIFSPAAFEISKNWRKAFSKKAPELLIIQLPSYVLREMGNLPLLEKELGDSVPFFIDSPNYEAQFAQLFKPEKALSLSAFSTKPSFSLSGTEALTGRLIAELSPEHHDILDSTSTSSTQLRRFIGTRIALSQPHFFVLARIGFLGAIFDGMKWDYLAADDSYRVSRFLEKGMASESDSAVRVLQLSEFGERDPIKYQSAGRWPESVRSSMRNDILSKIDFMVGRGLGALRQHKALSIAVVPYPDRINSSAFSRGFLRLGEGISDPLTPQIRAGKSNMRIYDLRALFNRDLWPGVSAEASNPSTGLSCNGVRVSTDLLSENGVRFRSDLINEMLSSLESNAKSLLRVAAGMEKFPQDIYSFAAFCRTKDGLADRIVVWDGSSGEKFSERNWPDLLNLFITKSRTSNDKNESQRPHRRETAGTGDASPSTLLLNERLHVWSIASNGILQRDSGGQEFISKSEWVLRSVFERLVLLERAN